MGVGRQKVYYDHSKYAKDEYRRGLGYGLALGIVAGIGGLVLANKVVPDWLHNNQISHAKTRTEDVQFYQPQITALLKARGIKLAEGTFPLISPDSDTFSFQITQGGISKICTARFQEYYSTARIDPDTDLTENCRKADTPMPSTPPEGYTQ